MAGSESYGQLYRLLAAWLHGTAPEGTDPDFAALLSLANSHSLTAAVCLALERTGLMRRCPPETAKRFQTAKLQSLRRTLLMEAEQRELLAALEQRGVWYLPLKGAVLNGLWPEPGARQFADVDILYDASRWKEVRGLMRQRGYKAKSYRANAPDSYVKPPVYSFEMHRSLFADDGYKGGFLPGCAAYYADVKARLRKDEGNGFGYHFGDEDFYIYFLAHAYKHYTFSGIGVRTLLDVYLYRQSRRDMDGAYIAGELKKLGLEDFERLFRSLGEKLFGRTPAPALALDEQQMLAWIESSGTYGTAAHRVEKDIRALQKGGRLSGRRARQIYLLRRFFPDMDWYRANAPFCFEHRWAIPAFWVYRLFRAAFVDGRYNLGMLKAICTTRDGKSVFVWAARALRDRLLRPFQKPVSRWPEEKRIARAMRIYSRQEGHTFDLAHPELFTEKRVWYLLFYEHPDMTRIYDKYLFKGYIEEKLGPGYTAPLYGMWTKVRDLARDWDSLPDAFVLKSNCSSLGKNMVFVRDKKAVDKKALFREAKKWLDPMNTGLNSCNRAYYGVTPRVIAEKLLSPRGGQLYDYKVMCFGGKPDHILATADRFPLEAEDLAYTFYDLQWNKLPVTARGHEDRDVPRPEHLAEMIGIAEKLSKGFPHIRVDFYDAAEGLLLGELTFYNTTVYEQPEWDLRLGQLFVLPGEEARTGQGQTA